MLNLSSRDAQLFEVEAIRETLRVNRDHKVHQGSLKSAMLLSKLVQPCASLGISIDAAATFDLANVLWDQGEMTTSIRMLQQLINQTELRKQSIPVNPAQVLASLVSYGFLSHDSANFKQRVTTSQKRDSKSLTPSFVTILTQP